MSRPIHEMESKWRKKWEEEGVYRAQTEGGEKFYGLVEFPYPSGDGLHVGHPRSYTAIDLVTRKKRMEGKNVLYPIGWDAFGLPTENYAIKNKIKPADATKKNIANFTRQTKSLGFGFDWSREVDTTDPAYFKWTQWQFLQFFKHGMAYKAASTINWCPRCKIGLANEEAQGGVCERCGSPVEKREKEQWMIRITDYAQRLLSDLEGVNYLEKIKSQQINWIGRSEGAEIVFRVSNIERLMVATSNKSKVARVKKLLGAVLPYIEVVTPVELGIEEKDVDEGDDLFANAAMKAAAYAGKTELPVLGMDTGFFIEGERLNPASPKRNALGGREESTMTQEEKAEAMDAFYRGIAERHGGEVEAYWKDVLVLRLSSGEEVRGEAIRPVILTSERKGEMDVYFPVRGLYKIKANRKYVAEQTEEEELNQELAPLKVALGDLLSEEVRVFTTRPDTVFGVTYVVLAPEHSLVARYVSRDARLLKEVQDYIDEVAKKTDEERTGEDKEKTGVRLPGVFAVNPVNGERVPVWTADYVLANYGTGAVMAVPAHDERDYVFAKKYGLSTKRVVNPILELSSDLDRVLRKQLEQFVELANKAKKELVVSGGYGVEILAQTQIRNHDDLDLCVRESDVEWWKEILIKDGFQIEPDLNGEKNGKKKDPRYKFVAKKLLGDQVVKVDVIVIGIDEVGRLYDMEWSEKDYWQDFVKEDVLTMQWKELPVRIFSTRVQTWLKYDRRPKDLVDLFFLGEMAYTEAGEAVQSDFLNGAPTWKAKEDCVSWLEEDGSGKEKITYKLRDWVFSRQRYWGEPIPLVHCKTCAKKKQKALIIHGVSANAEMNWYPTLKAALEKQGFEVFAPNMLEPSAPTYEGWMGALRPLVEQLGEDDVVVGHSLGGLMAVHALQETKRKIGYLYLVAPLIGPISDEEWVIKSATRTDRDYSGVRKAWERSIDWTTVASLVGSGNVLVSDDDTRVPKASHAFIPEGWYIKSLGAQGHFVKEDCPEILREVLASKNTGWIPVPDEQLPLTLPDIEAYEPTDTGESPLAKIESWVQTTCPRCGGEARRETDTMPNWAGSSWYFLRYCDPKNDEALASKEALKYWMPVDLYNGGMEHTTLHLLYSRFWYKFLWDLGVVPEECGSEPYKMRRSHNMILGEGGVKMSKSKGNVVNPDDVVEKYGSDVFRVYEMFIGPYDQPAPWDTNGIEGVKRFLDKVWGVCGGDVACNTQHVTSELETLYHQTVKKVSEGLENLQFNTSVSQLMILTNAFQDVGGVPETMMEGYLKVLAPFAPHLAEEIWREKLGKTTSIHARGAGWPAFDASKLQAATFELVVQVGGKVRDKVTVASDISEEEAKATALASEKVQKWVEGKEPKQVVYVKGRLVSIVL